MAGVRDKLGMPLGADMHQGRFERSSSLARYHWVGHAATLVGPSLQTTMGTNQPSYSYKRKNEKKIVALHASHPILVVSAIFIAQRRLWVCTRRVSHFLHGQCPGVATYGQGRGRGAGFRGR